MLKIITLKEKNQRIFKNLYKVLLYEIKILILIFFEFYLIEKKFILNFPGMDIKLFRPSFGAFENILNKLEWESCKKLLLHLSEQNIYDEYQIFYYITSRFNIDFNKVLFNHKYNRFQFCTESNLKGGSEFGNWIDISNNWNNLPKINWPTLIKKELLFKQEKLFICNIHPFSQMMNSIFKEYKLLTIIPLPDFNFAILFLHFDWFYIRIVSANYVFASKLKSNKNSNGEKLLHDSTIIQREYYIKIPFEKYEIEDGFITNKINKLGIETKNYFIWWIDKELIQIRNNFESNQKYIVNLNLKENLFSVEQLQPNDKLNNHSNNNFNKRTYRPYLWILNKAIPNSESVLTQNFIFYKIPNTFSFLFLQWAI